MKRLEQTLGHDSQSQFQALVAELLTVLNKAHHGTGFSKGMLKRPSETFGTTKPHGLGLGLPICRSIIAWHGDRLWLANNEKGGATVRFSLPAHQKESS